MCLLSVKHDQFLMQIRDKSKGRRKLQSFQHKQGRLNLATLYNAVRLHNDAPEQQRQCRSQGLRIARAQNEQEQKLSRYRRFDKMPP